MMPTLKCITDVRERRENEKKKKKSNNSLRKRLTFTEARMQLNF